MCEAVAGLAAAIKGFDAADMQLHAAASRGRLGALVGGDEGRALRDESSRWMAAQAVRQPVAMTQLIAPGFPD